MENNNLDTNWDGWVTPTTEEFLNRIDEVFASDAQGHIDAVEMEENSRDWDNAAQEMEDSRHYQDEPRNAMY